MSRVRILTVEAVAEFADWVATNTGPLGTALDATGRAWSIAGTNGASFTFPAEDGEVVSAVLAAVSADGRRVWADHGTATAKTLTHRSGLPVDRFQLVGCVQTMRAVLRPGVTPPTRPTTPFSAAVAVAREVTELHATFPVEERRLALESVRQDILWRPRQLAGLTLDLPLLRAETQRVWGAKRRMAAELGIDLTGDGADVFEWVADHGITILDHDGVPTMSRKFLEDAVVPEAALEAWKVFRPARSLKSSMVKLLELTNAEKAGTVYPEVIIRHAVTGRGTIRRPGLQNITGSLRPLLAAAPGKVLVGLDIDRCEVTLAAAMSGCPGLSAALAAGDPYVQLVISQHGMDEAGNAALRARYKKALLACLYGQGARSLGVQLGITTEAAKDLKAGLKREWPRLFEWIGENTVAAKAGGVGRTLTGRATPALESSSAYKRTNHMVQGSGSDFLYRGVERIAERLGADVLYLTVHDEVVVEVAPEEAEVACRVLVESMTFNLPGDLLLTGTAIMVGQSWGK